MAERGRTSQPHEGCSSLRSAEVTPRHGPAWSRPDACLPGPRLLHRALHPAHTNTTEPTTRPEGAPAAPGPDSRLLETPREDGVTWATPPRRRHRPQPLGSVPSAPARMRVGPPRSRPAAAPSARPARGSPARLLEPRARGRGSPTARGRTRSPTCVWLPSPDASRRCTRGRGRVQPGRRPRSFRRRRGPDPGTGRRGREGRTPARGGGVWRAPRKVRASPRRLLSAFVPGRLARKCPGGHHSVGPRAGELRLRGGRQAGTTAPCSAVLSLSFSAQHRAQHQGPVSRLSVRAQCPAQRLAPASGPSVRAFQPSLYSRDYEDC